MASKQTEKQPADQSRREPKKEVRVVTTPLDPAKTSPVEWKKLKALPGAFSIFVIGEAGQTQVTFHRPIGSTDLDQDDWVATPTGDIQSLLSRAVDPREKQLSGLETQVLLRIAVEEGILVKDPATGFHTYPDTGIVRELAFEAAQKEAATEVARLRQVHDQAQVGKTKKAEFRHNVTREQFFTEPLRAGESKLKQLRKDRQAQIRAEVPRTYRTLGGALGDKPQRRSGLIPKGSTADEAQMAVTRGVSRLIEVGHFTGRPDLFPTAARIAQIEKELADWRELISKLSQGDQTQGEAEMLDWHSAQRLRAARPDPRPDGSAGGPQVPPRPAPVSGQKPETGASTHQEKDLVGEIIFPKDKQPSEEEKLLLQEAIRAVEALDGGPRKLALIAELRATGSKKDMGGHLKKIASDAEKKHRA